MALLLMVVLLGLALSALLVPMIITSDRTTRFDSTRVQALDAAQAGIDVTLGVIRTAVTTGVGDSGKLPCGPLSGPVNSTGAAAYSVVIEYFTFDPATEPYPAPVGDAMKCSPGYGTYDTATAVITPRFARITSTGTVGAAVNGSTSGRTLRTTYVFQTSNTNIAGGVIQIYPNSATSSMCMDVGSAGAVGSSVLLQACSTSTPPSAGQVFAYRTDLTIQLVSSVTSANGICSTNPTVYCGLCLNTQSTPAASGNSIVLSRCGPLGSPAPYTEQWSFNDWGSLQASQSSSQTDGVLANLCMNVTAQTAALPVTVAACNSNSSADPTQAWIPAPSVGAGAAAAPQWVNYAQFGRCIDIPAKQVGSNHLFTYPCKQNPAPGQVADNQKFAFPAIAAGQSSASGQLVTICPSTFNGCSTAPSNYCLTSPGTNGGYPTTVPCAAGAAQTWTVYGSTPSLSYTNKYRIIDSTGLCLGLTTPYSGDVWSAIDVETCSGATDQKWNANPNVLAASLKNTLEK